MNCFNQNASANNLILQNFKKAGFADPFLTDAVLEDIANFVYEVSSGYPFIIQYFVKKYAY